MLGFSVERLQADMNRLLALLFRQGVLDEQFLQLQELQDEASPNFVAEIIDIYLDESEKLLRSLREIVMVDKAWDHKKMGMDLNRLTGSSSSVGANRVRNICLVFRFASEQNNRVGCRRAMEVLEYEYGYLKSKLHEIFQIEQRRIIAGAVRYHPHNP